jgi:hypothetical protein
MTNNEKIQKIQGIVIDAAINGQKVNVNKDYCSAEWIYKKGWDDAMVRIKEIVCDIINEEV